jgi:cyclopropane fatty-acyl-phospholipid synthase-like methyltransferase
MEDKILKFYEKLYSKNSDTKYVFGHPEKELVKFLRSFNTKRTKMLDLGCGDGRNTVFLASKNYDVWGIDNSAYGLDIIKRQIKNTEISKHVHLIRKNLKTIKLKRRNYFDFIICVYTFHEIGLKGVRNIVRQAKFSVKPSGIIYFAFFINKKGTHIRKECYYPKNESVIIKQFRGWKIIRKKKVSLIHSHFTPNSIDKNIKHEHYLCHLFLQKPK